ncbi:hypothetical protein TWF696_008955 [Orbilia brochopaga]|uniref:Uncharacterized protein n=1 Tax=Orbilia brochopaga TaxID=3140254 RepID=A0AAV9UHU1_9PEZI
MLGFNHPENFTVQHRMNCSVLDVGGRIFDSALNTRTGNYYANYSSRLRGYEFGSLNDASESGYNPVHTEGFGVNVTEVYNPLSAIVQYEYTVSGIYYIWNSDVRTWNPTLALRVMNASTSLIGISANSIEYYTPQHDPVFLALIIRDVAPGVRLYAPIQHRSFIGCAEDMQFCNPSTKLCTGFIAEPNSEVIEAGGRLGWTKAQVKEIIQPYVQALTRFHPLAVMVSARGASGLLASAVLQQRYSADLSEEQWKLEVRNMFETKHTAVKFMLDAHATGAGLESIPNLRILTNNPEDGFCKKPLYVINTSEPYTSIRFAALIVTISLCAADSQDVKLADLDKLTPNVAMSSVGSEWERGVDVSDPN